MKVLFGHLAVRIRVDQVNFNGNRINELVCVAVNRAEKQVSLKSTGLLKGNPG